MIMGNIFTTETRRISFENTLESPFARIEKEYLKERKMLKAAALKKQEENGTGESPDPAVIEPSEIEINIDEPCFNPMECLDKEEDEIPPNENENDNETETEDNLIEETPKMKQERCFKLRSKMLECYEINQQHPLRCAEVVEAFNKCVLSYRVEEE